VFHIFNLRKRFAGTPVIFAFIKKAPLAALFEESLSGDKQGYAVFCQAAGEFPSRLSRKIALPAIS
jgi:hypothetical protein